MNIDRSIKDRLFKLFNYSFLLMFALLCVLPFIHVIAASFATVEEVIKKQFLLFPTTFYLEA
ncbi:ABC transporter permease, partial [Bacillus pumilus]